MTADKPRRSGGGCDLLIVVFKDQKIAASGRSYKVRQALLWWARHENPTVVSGTAAGSVYGKALLDALTRLGAAVRAQQVDLFAARTGCHHHAFGDPEAHFARFEVGDHHGQATFKLGRVRVGALDPGEHVALLVTDVQGQAQQLVGTFHGFGLEDQRNTQVHGSEGVELDFRRQRVLGQFAI